MTQIARNLTDEVDGFFKEKRYLIHDRDPLYTPRVRGNAEGRRYRICEIAAAITEPECLRGAFRAQYQECLEQMIVLARNR